MTAAPHRGPVANVLRTLSGVTLRTLAVAVLVLGTAVVALLSVDRVNRPARATDPGIASVDTTVRHRRLLLLHVDSWRDSSARDSTLFPRTAQLRRLGASGTLEGVYEGFTVPAVRAAFTGVAETQLVNIIQNFRFSALPLSSVFRDAHGLGRRTLVVAREPFVQFGPVLEIRYDSTPGVDMYDTDAMRPRIALEAYAQGYDIVVCQWETLDWVAHEDGVSTARYREAALTTDSVIAAFAAARAPEDYLLVYGDHGHTWTGEHKTGYDIPGFLLLIGPDVTPGADVDEMSITNLRYLSSHALGITLRGAPYDLAAIRQAIPIRDESAESDARAAASLSDEASGTTRSAPTSEVRDGDVHGVSTNPTDYVTVALLLLALAAVATLCVRLVGGNTYSVRTLVPVLLLLAGAMTVAPWVPPVDAWLRPAGLPSVIALYVVAVIAKLALFVRTAKGRWPVAVLATAVAAAFQFWNVIFDRPLLVLLLVLAAAVGALIPRDERLRDVSRLALLQLLVIATLRVPLYLYAWLDLALLAVVLIASHARALAQPALRDAGIVLAAYACTIGWVPGGIEWSFLYTVFPAHLVELEVQRFLPFIMAKIPLVLIMFLVTTGRRPDRGLAQVTLLMLGLRFVAIWAMGLAGAPTVELWPLAEHGAYLATFVVAVIAWGWQVRTTTEVRPQAT